jgi:hypothetical protein
MTLRAIALLGASLALTGCGLFERERTIPAADARQAVQAQLGVALTETAPVSVLPTLTDVEATYTMKSPDEELLLLVFSTPDATVQFTGPGTKRTPAAIVVRNVVAVYEHRPGTVSRRAQVRAALVRLDAATA